MRHLTTQLQIERRTPRSSVRPLIVGLICVLTVVGSVFVVQSIPRLQWVQQCAGAGGRVVSHSGGAADPYLAHGSQISFTCEGAARIVAPWP